MTRREGLARERVPVLRPQLPKARAVAKYLRWIDENRTYTNFGPLTAAFQSGLAEWLGIGEREVVSVSSGTAGLMAAMLCLPPRAPRRNLALMPAFSFAATAIAAERCGFEPYFADVDAATWALDPTALEHHPRLAEIGVVISVSPFGRPTPHDPWQAFQKRTGIPVVIDAAAAFANVMRDPAPYVGHIPTVFSFHATKSFGIGEGGCVVSTDRDLAERLSASTNFGFRGCRDSAAPSLNGKLNEYQAAVGLAALDEWPAKAAALERVAAAYRARMARRGLDASFFNAPEVDFYYALFMLPDADATARLERALDEAGVDYRFWYGDGLHAHSHFAGRRRDDLPITRTITKRLIGLPMAHDLRFRDLDVITSVLYKTIY